eukprot:GHVQ01008780.1.p1 GENE.GHVQ01008780.1~~GHVQ01008780.1.p1  ORF type:complete len:214 (+),score=52.70 GHVQ01008780.1:64-705(+)
MVRVTFAHMNSICGGSRHTFARKQIRDLAKNNSKELESRTHNFCHAQEYPSRSARDVQPDQFLAERRDLPLHNNNNNNTNTNTNNNNKNNNNNSNNNNNRTLSKQHHSDKEVLPAESIRPPPCLSGPEPSRSPLKIQTQHQSQPQQTAYRAQFLSTGSSPIRSSFLVRAYTSCTRRHALCEEEMDEAVEDSARLEEITRWLSGMFGRLFAIAK